jgi:hypothetical protein
LDHSNAVNIYNKGDEDETDMRLRIEKWNDKVENEVVKHLNEIFGQEIQPDSVRDVSLLEKVTHTKFEINSICNKLTL